MLQRDALENSGVIIIYFGPVGELLWSMYAFLVTMMTGISPIRIM